MPKKRDEPYRNATFSLSEEVLESIGNIAKFEDMTKNELVEYLVKNWEIGINPSEKLIHLNKEREKIMEKLNILDKEIKETSNQMKMFEEWKKKKSIKKKEAIEILKRKILDEDFEEAERLSKVWQKVTGVNSLELLYDAKKSIDISGI